MTWRAPEARRGMDFPGYQLPEERMVIARNLLRG
jgi:hypothetical protein